MASRAPKRLVEEEYLGLADERTGQRHPLLPGRRRGPRASRATDRRGRHRQGHGWRSPATRASADACRHCRRRAARQEPRILEQELYAAIESVTGSPPTVMRPAFGRSSPEISRSMVVFPQPDRADRRIASSWTGFESTGRFGRAPTRSPKSMADAVERDRTADALSPGRRRHDPREVRRDPWAGGALLEPKGRWWSRSCDCSSALVVRCQDSAHRSSQCVEHRQACRGARR